MVGWLLAVLCYAVIAPFDAGLCTERGQEKESRQGRQDNRQQGKRGKAFGLWLLRLLGLLLNGLRCRGASRFSQKPKDS
jgi:hypothetical protein